MEKDKQVEYENRLVAFIDILGFKEIIKESESDKEKLGTIYDVVKFLKDFEQPKNWPFSLIAMEESAQYKGLAKFDIKDDARVTAFSDSIVFSVRLKDGDIRGYFSALVVYLSYVGMILIQTGVLWRGAITIGNLIHEVDGTVLGQGLVDAYLLESRQAKDPRIILSNKLISKLQYPIINSSEMYPHHQYIERFGDGCVGFHQLKYFEVVESGVAKEQEEPFKNSVKRAKDTIIRGLDANFETPDVFKKFSWLKEAYNHLIVDAEIKGQIYNLNEGIREGNIKYSYTDNFYNKKRIKTKG